MNTHLIISSKGTSFGSDWLVMFPPLGYSLNFDATTDLARNRGVVGIIPRD